MQRVFVDFLTITLLQFYLCFLGILLKNNAQTDRCLSISCKIEGFTLDEKREVRSAARGNGARQRIYVIINLSSLSGYAIRNRIIGEATLLSKGAETNETI